MYIINRVLLRFTYPASFSNCDSPGCPASAKAVAEDDWGAAKAADDWSQPGLRPTPFCGIPELWSTILEYFFS